MSYVTLGCGSVLTLVLVWIKFAFGMDIAWILVLLPFLAAIAYCTIQFVMYCIVSIFVAYVQYKPKNQPLRKENA